MTALETPSGIDQVKDGVDQETVDAVREVTELIEAQRGYEMNAKVMGVADQMLQTVNNIR